MQQDAIPFRAFRRFLPMVFATALFMLISGLSAPAARGQKIYVLHTFSGLDGSGPRSVLVQSRDAEGALYGTTPYGGNGFGTIFKITTNGDFKLLYTFLNNGSDGALPLAGLVQARDGNFYGTTSQGGDNGVGIIFRITASGIFTPLYSFTKDDGGGTYAGLVQTSDAEGALYGTTPGGGKYNNGMIFKITTGGVFMPVYSFSAKDSNWANADGAYPWAGLIQGKDGALYGITSSGGIYGAGAIFKITTKGVLTPLHSFNIKDGYLPVADLMQATDGNLYGTTTQGGTDSSDGGVIFQVSPTGAFTSYNIVNIGRSFPYASLVEATASDNALYGTTTMGGKYGQGTIFKITTSGKFAPIYPFSNLPGAKPGSVGYAPYAGMIQATDGNLYGTTSLGGVNPDGTNGSGTIYQLVMQKQYTVTPSAGSRGVISPSTPQRVGQGVSVSFTATPNTGCLVGIWQLDGSTVQTGGTSYTVSNIAASHSLIVTFQLQTFKVTPSAGTNGTISPNTPQTISYGAGGSFNAKAATGFLVDQWQVDGKNAQSSGSWFTLSRVTSAHSVNVTFKLQTFKVTPLAGANGTISPNTPQTVNYGANISFRANAATGFRVDQWQVDGMNAQSGGSFYQLSSVTVAHTIRVTFKQQTFKVTSLAGANGTIIPATVQTVNYGANVSFSAKATTGFNVALWQLDGTTVQVGGTTYKLAAVKADHTVKVTFK